MVVSAHDNETKTKVRNVFYVSAHDNETKTKVRNAMFLTKVFSIGCIRDYNFLLVDFNELQKDRKGAKIATKNWTQNSLKYVFL